MPRVSTTDLSGVIGVTDQQVRNLIKANVLTTAEREGRAYTLDLDRSVEEYEAFVKATDEAGKDWNVERMKHDARYKKARADMMELDLAEKRGEYHRAEFVRDAMDDMVYAVRAALLALPGKLAPTLVGIADKAVMAAAVKDEVHSVLEDLSRYEYSADYYHERLAELRGKNLQDD